MNEIDSRALPDRFEHRGIGFIAIDEPIDAVAHQHGALGHVADDSRKLDQPRTVAPELSVQVRRRAWRFVQRNTEVRSPDLSTFARR